MTQGTVGFVVAANRGRVLEPEILVEPGNVLVVVNVVVVVNVLVNV